MSKLLPVQEGLFFTDIHLTKVAANAKAKAGLFTKARASSDTLLKHHAIKKLFRDRFGSPILRFQNYNNPLGFLPPIEAIKQIPINVPLIDLLNNIADRIESLGGYLSREHDFNREDFPLSIIIRHKKSQSFTFEFDKSETKVKNKKNFLDVFKGTIYKLTSPDGTTFEVGYGQNDPNDIFPLTLYRLFDPIKSVFSFNKDIFKPTRYIKVYSQEIPPEKAIIMREDHNGYKEVQDLDTGLCHQEEGFNGLYSNHKAILNDA